jgi:hypothetical protein
VPIVNGNFSLPFVANGDQSWSAGTAPTGWTSGGGGVDLYSAATAKDPMGLQAVDLNSPARSPNS